MGGDEGLARRGEQEVGRLEHVPLRSLWLGADYVTFPGSMLSRSWRGKSLPDLQAATNPRLIQSRRDKRYVVRGWSGEKGSRYPQRIIYVLIVFK